MEAEFQRSRTQTQESYHQETAKRAADFQRQQEQARAAHQKNLARMEEDHYMRMWDLTLSRDAAGLYKEKQSYDVQRRRAEEDFADQQGQRGQDFAREQAERAAQHEQRMADLQREYDERRSARRQEYAERVTELEQEHAADMQRLKREYFERINSELGFYKLSQTQQNAYHAAMLTDTQIFLARNRSMWAAYVNSLPVPRSGYRPTTGSGGAQGTGGGTQYYQEGGYVRHTGPAFVHAGEFVLSGRTARQLEGAVGGRLTQQSVVNRGVTVNANFTGVGPSDRGWIEQRLGDFSRELAGMLQ
jgi:hypothetical protein